MQLRKKGDNRTCRPSIAITQTGHNFLDHPVDYQCLRKLQSYICYFLPFLADPNFLMIPGKSLHNSMPKSVLMWKVNFRRAFNSAWARVAKTDHQDM